MKTLGLSIIVAIILTISPSMHTYGHPHKQTVKPYFEKIYSSEPIPIAEAILDKASGFIFLKLARAHEAVGSCPISESTLQYIAFPLIKIQDYLTPQWHVLSVSYQVNATSVQYLLESTDCDLDNRSQSFTKLATPDQKDAFLAKDLVVLFPDKNNRAQWVGVLEKYFDELGKKQKSKLKALGGGMISLKAR
jgi:hypothetical protein